MANVYQMVTDRIINQLEQGKIPWRKPWNCASLRDVPTGAFNGVTKKSYSLLNQMLLENEGEYATFKQWKDIGGKVKKGSKSEMVVFWTMLEKEEIVDGETKKRKIPYLRYYNVFHISQVDNVEPLDLDTEEITNEIETNEYADNVVIDYITREHINFNETLSREAYYSPSLDKVVVPKKEQYENINEYYSTLFHELVHSTGNKNRLNRLDGTKNASFGSTEYSKEELVAEIGSSMILNVLDIETPDTFINSSAYIQSWLGKLRDDSKFIVSASSKAEKASKYILAID